jgi:hypothetical protein
MDDQLVVEGDDVGAADPGHRRDDAHPVEAATERDAAAVSRSTARSGPSGDGRLVTKMLAQPRLAFREEGVRPALVLRTDRSRGDGDDDAAVRMDDDTQDACPG